MDTAPLFYLLMALALVNALLAFLGTRGFFAAHGLIDGPGALEDFKQMVRRQMYQALAQLFLLLGANAVALFGLVTGQVKLLAIITLNGAVIIVSKPMKKVEERLRRLEVSDQALKDEYGEICRTWLGKPLPDF